MYEIGKDFQGWPTYAMTLREILLDLGCETDENGNVIFKNQELLDSYPILLRDDGMGYGVNPRLIIETDKETRTVENGLRVFNLFDEKPDFFKD